MLLDRIDTLQQIAEDYRSGIDTFKLEEYVNIYETSLNEIFHINASLAGYPFVTDMEIEKVYSISLDESELVTVKLTKKQIDEYFTLVSHQTYQAAKDVYGIDLEADTSEEFEELKKQFDYLTIEVSLTPIRINKMDGKE